jgi:hypothetical protein
MEPVSHCVGLRVHDPGSIPSSLTGQYMQGLAPTTLAEGYIDLSSRSTRTTRFTHVLLPVLPTQYHRRVFEELIPLVRNT